MTAPITDAEIAEIRHSMETISNIAAVGWPSQTVAALLDRLDKAEAGWRVRPLEWREETSGFYWSAPSELGRYHITHYRGMPFGFKLEYGGGMSSYFDDIDKAKAQANSDYETRIRAALLPPPPGDKP